MSGTYCHSTLNRRDKPCRLVSYEKRFVYACDINKPLVKVLCLVDGDKPTMGYLYEAMDRAKESIRAYYEDKMDEGYERRLLIWKVIDERWNNTLHCLIHVVGIYLNPVYSYSCGFIFDAEVMDGFLTCV